MAVIYYVICAYICIDEVEFDVISNASFKARKDWLAVH